MLNTHTDKLTFLVWQYYCPIHKRWFLIGRTPSPGCKLTNNRCRRRRERKIISRCWHALLFLRWWPLSAENDFWKWDQPKKKINFFLLNKKEFILFFPLMQFKTFGGKFLFFKKKRKGTFFLSFFLFSFYVCLSLELHRAARQDPGQSGATGRSADDL